MFIARLCLPKLFTVASSLQLSSWPCHQYTLVFLQNKFCESPLTSLFWMFGFLLRGMNSLEYLAFYNGSESQDYVPNEPLCVKRCTCIICVYLFCPSGKVCDASSPQMSKPDMWAGSKARTMQKTSGPPITHSASTCFSLFNISFVFFCLLNCLLQSFVNIWNENTYSLDLKRWLSQMWIRDQEMKDSYASHLFD